MDGGWGQDTEERVRSCKFSSQQILVLVWFLGLSLTTRVVPMVVLMIWGLRSPLKVPVRLLLLR